MIVDAAIREFVDCLSQTGSPDHKSENIYKDPMRRANLLRWFLSFDDVPGSAIFVGEAPGIFGARISGIPFVSPNVIMSQIDPWGELRSENGYKIPPGENVSQREKSATRLWKHMPPIFDGLPRPLTWNIYPFWPFASSKSGVLANRAPTKDEIAIGSGWLVRVVEIYPNSRVVAVGNKAQDTLESIGIDAPLVPHPSRGSDEKLINSLERVAENLRHLD